MRCIAQMRLTPLEQSRHGLPKKKPRQAYSDEEEHARHHEAHSSSRRQVQEIKVRYPFDREVVAHCPL